MESLEGTHRELDATGERLRSTEAQRITATREAESLRHQLGQLDLQCHSLQAALKQRWKMGSMLSLSMSYATNVWHMFVLFFLTFLLEYFLAYVKHVQSII